MLCSLTILNDLRDQVVFRLNPESLLTAAVTALLVDNQMNQNYLWEVHQTVQGMFMEHQNKWLELPSRDW